jgi:hypothetical protein
MGAVNADQEAVLRMFCLRLLDVLAEHPHTSMRGLMKATGFSYSMIVRLLIVLEDLGQPLDLPRGDTVQLKCGVDINSLRDQLRAA